MIRADAGFHLNSIKMNYFYLNASIIESLDNTAPESPYIGRDKPDCMFGFDRAVITATIWRVCVMIPRSRR